MSDKSKRATLNITHAFKEDLNRMRLANESYEEILKREIGGYTYKLPNASEPVAFDLKGFYTDSEDEFLKVFWSDLYRCNLGDFWSVRDSDDCTHRETASVIYRDNDVALVKFKTMKKIHGVRCNDVEVVSFNFLSDNIY